MNINQISNYNVQFKGIAFYSDSKSMLRKTLTREEKIAFANLYNVQLENKNTEVRLYGRTNGVDLRADVWELRQDDSDGDVVDRKVASFKPHFWQSNMDIIRKACKCADKLEQEIIQRPSVRAFDEIIGNN